MSYPNPILLGQTPAGGFTLTVTGDPGGLSGYVLLGQLGPPLTVEVSQGGLDWATVAYPHTLSAGETLRLKRVNASAELSTLRALAPVIAGDGPPDPSADPYTVSSDPDGYQTVSNATAETDPDGYQTLPDATATTDPDGYQSAERS